MNDDYAAYREGLYRISLRVQQINYLRAVLKEIAARDPGIKTSAHSDAMGPVRSRPAPASLLPLLLHNVFALAACCLTQAWATDKTGL